MPQGLTPGMGPAEPTKGGDLKGEDTVYLASPYAAYGAMPYSSMYRLGLGNLGYTAYSYGYQPALPAQPIYPYYYA